MNDPRPLPAAVSAPDAWMPGLAGAVSAIGRPGFADMLATALRLLGPFGMMNGFVYSPDGRAFDLYNEKIVAERALIVDRYLAGAFLLDPFYDAIREDRNPRLIVMRELAPDDFRETEYYRQHYATTRIVDEIGFVLPLDKGFTGILSLSRTGVAPLFASQDIARFAAAAPLVCATAARHWFDLPDGLLDRGRDAPAPKIAHPLLTRRELEIVTLVLKGHSNLSLAAVLSLSPNTVKVHRRQIYAKLNISSQAELFRLFLA